MSSLLPAPLDKPDIAHEVLHRANSSLMLHLVGWEVLSSISYPLSIAAAKASTGRV